MGRPPIGKVAMTGAERMRRHRQKQRVTKPVTKPDVTQPVTKQDTTVAAPSFAEALLVVIEKAMDTGFTKEDITAVHTLNPKFDYGDIMWLADTLYEWLSEWIEFSDGITDPFLCEAYRVLEVDRHTANDRCLHDLVREAFYARPNAPAEANRGDLMNWVQTLTPSKARKLAREFLKNAEDDDLLQIIVDDYVNETLPRFASSRFAPVESKSPDVDNDKTRDETCDENK